ncbi:ABC-type branched-chain amino acid transport system, ATPase component [Cenarchaeum symbiosum A]|uniref:ABC-type branched-chain amino acid transport system, ATPase component n=1 Tax=Cenarchaeum symbiosum (strain A) TaxID=414004 RepID=A0RWY3_CENSY|nr:ABC-type branched-chain amino acid transport system, ATPase component [Cenarchaeum symbiosum A]
MIQISDVTKSFGGNKAVDGATFDVEPNKVNLLIGANGSGKTTIINMISGLLHPDSGSITDEGADITHYTPDRIYHRGIMRTFQTPRLFAELSVMENMLMAAKIDESFRHALLPSKWSAAQREARKKATEILESLGMGELGGSLAYNLSGGQIKLLELAKGLMARPRTILLDEPIAGIAPALAHKIFKTIRGLAASMTFLIVEHRLDIALGYSDRVIVLDDGRVIAVDAPDHVLSNEKVVESYL